MKNIYLRLSKGFIFSLLGQMGNYLIAFLLAPIYAKALPPEEYGIVSFANSLRNILTILMPMGVGGAIVYWYNKHLNETIERKKRIGGIFLLSTTFSFLWLLIFILLGTNLIGNLFEEIELNFYPFGLYIGFSAFFLSFSVIPTSLFVAQERIALNSLLSTISALIQTIIIIYFVAYLKLGARGQIIAMLIAGLLIIFTYIVFLLKEIHLYFNLKFFAEVLKFSIPLLPHTLFMWILNLSDRVIISSFGKGYLRELGFYSFGYAIGMVMQGIMSAFNTIWSAVFMREANVNVRAKEVLGKSASYGILLLSFFASTLILFSKEAVNILSFGKYSESAKYIPPVILGYFFQGLYMFPGMSLYFLKKTYLFPVITGIGALVNILVNFTFIPIYGVFVASIATAIGFFTMAFLSFIFGHLPYPLKYKFCPIFLSFIFIFISFVVFYKTDFGLIFKIGLSFVFFIISALIWFKDYRRDLIYENR